MVLLVKLQQPFCGDHNLVLLLENLRTTFSDLVWKVAITTRKTWICAIGYCHFLGSSADNKPELLLDCTTDGQHLVLEFQELYNGVCMWHKNFESFIQSVLTLPNQKQCK